MAVSMKFHTTLDSFLEAMYVHMMLARTVASPNFNEACKFESETHDQRTLVQHIDETM